MDRKKFLEVVTIYRKLFENRRTPRINFPHELFLSNYGSQARAEALAHCHGMLDEMEQFVAEERMEKAFRWLGFIQGCLWSAGDYTLEELKNHNRPDLGPEEHIERGKE